MRIILEIIIIKSVCQGKSCASTSWGIYCINIFKTSFTVVMLSQKVSRISIRTNWFFSKILTHSFCSLKLGLKSTLNFSTLSQAKLIWKKCRLRRLWSTKFWQTMPVYLRLCLPRNALFNLTSPLLLLSLMSENQIPLRQSLLTVANCLMASLTCRIQTIRHILAFHRPQSTVALRLQLKKATPNMNITLPGKTV